MFFNTSSIRINVFFLFLCYAMIRTEALSIASAKSSSVNVREITSISIGQSPNRHEYQIERLSEGQFGSVFTIIGGYYGHDAVLKFIEEPKPKDLSKTKEEVKNLNLVGLFLWSETSPSGVYSLLVMRDARYNFPNPGDRLNLFHEWYTQNPTWQVLEKLKAAQNSIMRRLLEFSDDLGLLYYDIKFENILMDATCTMIMPVDWAPEDAVSSGVINVKKMSSKDAKQHRKHHVDHLNKRLLSQFSLRKLAKLVPLHWADKELLDAGY